ncbi:MAG: LysR substrate-binding domain-containing protein [Pseudomonadota bacterium]
MILNRTVEYVLAAHQMGNFAMAAEACAVSQPSLSVQIKKLEAFLGEAIFTRTKRGVALTAFGQEVLPKLQQLKALETELRSRVAIDAGGKALRIGAISTLAPSVVPFLLRHDGVTVMEGTTARLLSAISEGDLDAAFAALPIVVPGLATFPLFHEPYLLASSAFHAPVEVRALDQLRSDTERRLVVLSSEHCAGDQTLHLCNANRGQTNRFLEATSLETARSMVAATQDFTLIPLLNQRMGDNLIYQSLPDRYRRQIGLVVRAAHPLRGQLEAVAQNVAKSIRSEMNGLSS